MVLNTCKQIREIWSSMVNRKHAAGAYRAGGEELPLNLTLAPRPSAGQTAGIDPKRAFPAREQSARNEHSRNKLRTRPFDPNQSLINQSADLQSGRPLFFETRLCTGTPGFLPAC